MLIRDAREYIAVSEKFLPEEERKAEFEAGQQVRHAILGTGTIVSVDTEKHAYLVSFDTLETPRRISFRVKLEKASDS